MFSSPQHNSPFVWGGGTEPPSAGTPAPSSPGRKAKTPSSRALKCWGSRRDPLLLRTRATRSLGFFHRGEEREESILQTSPVQRCGRICKRPVQQSLLYWTTTCKLSFLLVSELVGGVASEDGERVDGGGDNKASVLWRGEKTLSHFT